MEQKREKKQSEPYMNFMFNLRCYLNELKEIMYEYLALAMVLLIGVGVLYIILHELCPCGY